MAQRGYLPSCFAARSFYGTPVVGIAMSSLGVVTMLVFSFGEIIEMLNAVYCLAELLEFAAFISLRYTRPELKRAYKYAVFPALVFMLHVCGAQCVMICC